MLLLSRLISPTSDCVGWLRGCPDHSRGHSATCQGACAGAASVTLTDKGLNSYYQSDCNEDRSTVIPKYFALMLIAKRCPPHIGWCWWIEHCVLNYWLFHHKRLTVKPQRSLLAFQPSEHICSSTANSQSCDLEMQLSTAPNTNY